ncbi:hypothetical protein RND81_12G122600 [Saponaria officinalis]|uniref:non-specific serine/threonine protein kinase n=1 Tax=Saponaria officinalis TaxID=3572 RepID=A0AAW1H9N3_SAPOF
MYGIFNQVQSIQASIKGYEIMKTISRGACAQTFLVRKRATGDLLAMKVFKKADSIFINGEETTWFTTPNPFMVKFYYSFTCKENVYSLMEYTNKGNLSSMLRSLGRLEEDMARGEIMGSPNLVSSRQLVAPIFCVVRCLIVH